MQQYVIHMCQNSYHTLPLTCHCYAIGQENAQLTLMCRERDRVLALDVHATAYQVRFESSATKGYYDVTRLRDTDKEAPNARE